MNRFPSTHLSILAFIATVTLLSSLVRLPAEEPTDPAGKINAPFELDKYKSFIDLDLSRPRPDCSLADMGIPALTTSGQLVDHQGQPLPNVAVAIVEPIGLSGTCYYDNFDTTDQQGRFSVAGSIVKTRLVFRKPNGRIWKLTPANRDQPVHVRWPQPATVSITMPQEIAEAAKAIHIQTPGYWSGMSVLRQSATLDGQGRAVFEDVIPSEYFVTVDQSVDVVDPPLIHRVEIGRLKVNEGDTTRFDCPLDGTSITGQYFAPEIPQLGKQRPYVLIRIQVG